MKLQWTGILTSLCLIQSVAFGYFETGESGEIQNPGTYRMGFMPQARLSDGSGFNASAFADTALNEATSLRAFLGGGDTDFYTGGSVKWIPIPDYKNQPAIGGKLEVIYGRKASDSLASFRFHPLISKKFEIEAGTLIPYASVPISMTTYRSNTETGINLVGGTEFRAHEIPNFEFGAELGLNINKSFSYLSGLVTYYFDENTFRKRK